MYHFLSFHLHHSVFQKHFPSEICDLVYGLPASSCSLWFLFQVHGLDAETWKKVDVVYIDIADRTQVEPKVKSLRSMWRLLLYSALDLLSPVSPPPFLFSSNLVFLSLSRTTSQRRIPAGSSQ